jgi:hypothetical protein
VDVDEFKLVAPPPLYLAPPFSRLVTASPPKEEIIENGNDTSRVDIKILPSITTP